MFTKLIGSVLPLFIFKSVGRNFNSQNLIWESVKKTFSDEIYAMRLKFFVGIILVSIFICSLFYLGNALHIFLGFYENGLLIEIGGLSALVVLSLLTLFLLFKRPKVKTNLAHDSLTIQGINFKSIILGFSEGFISGFEKNKSFIEFKNATMSSSFKRKNSKTTENRSNFLH